MSEPAAKKARTMPRIGTHSGTFHADEALACYMLRQTDQYKDAEIVRTRDTALLDTLDILVDVGAVYAPERNRFDHHQRGFEETFDDKHTVKLSSAGLIYKHFGKDIIREMSTVPLDDATLDMLHVKIYDELIEGLDGIDNGVHQYPADLKPVYKDGTNLPARVGRLNPMWNQSNVDADAQFAKAMAIAGEELADRVRYFTKAWLPARTIVVDALRTRHDVDPSGRIVVLECGCPWKDHFFTLEDELGLDDSNNILFVLYPDDSGSWRVQGVPIHPGSFECRRFLPEPWRGVRDDALSALTGIPGGVFVHANGFIGGNKTKEGALAMARAALQ